MFEIKVKLKAEMTVEASIEALNEWRNDMRKALEEAADAARAGDIAVEAALASILDEMLGAVAEFSAATPAEVAERLGGADYGDVLGWGMGLFGDVAEVASGNKSVLDMLGQSDFGMGKRLHDVISDGKLMEGDGETYIQDMIWFELDSEDDPVSGYTYYIQTDENGPYKTVTDPHSGYEYRVLPDPQAEIDRLNGVGEDEEIDYDTPDEMEMVEVTYVDEFGDEVTVEVLRPIAEEDGENDNEDDQIPLDPNIHGGGAPMRGPDETDDPTYGLILTDPERFKSPPPETLENDLDPLILTDPEADQLIFAPVFTEKELDPTYGQTQPPIVDETGGGSGAGPIPSNGGDVMVAEVSADRLEADLKTAPINVYDDGMF